MSYSSIEWRLRKIYSPEEQEERAAKALVLNGITVEPETETELFPQLRAASKKKPTVRVNRLDYRLRAAPPSSQRQRQTKLKAAASPSPPSSSKMRQVVVPAPSSSSSSVQIAAVIPTHDIPNHIIQSLNPDKTTLMAKTSCLGCGAKATQILQFTPGHEIRPTANPKILPKLCHACRGDMHVSYSGSAL